MSLLIEVGNLDGLIVLVLVIMFGPPIIFAIIGAKLSDKKKSKIYYIISVAYVLIGLGVCGSMMVGF